LEDRHKIALFSNIYNAMIIHATCVLGSPADSPAARAEFFSGRSGATYIIGKRKGDVGRGGGGRGEVDHGVYGNG
jgi:hypothetical protein